MPNPLINEDEIRRITEKYIKEVVIDPNSIPNIRAVITEALKEASLGKDITENDIAEVVQGLRGRKVINNKVILEVSKKVANHNADDDLKFTVNNYLKQLKPKNYTLSDKDVDAVIKKGKLDANTSTPYQIKNAVKDYFTSPQTIEMMPEEQVVNAIKSELGNYGDFTDKDVKVVLRRYLDSADQEKPIDQKELQAAVKRYVATQPVPAKTMRPGASMPQEMGVQEPTTNKGAENAAQPQTGKVKAGPVVPPKDPKNLTLFEKIRAKMRRYGIKALTRGARNWLTDTVNAADKTYGKPDKWIQQGQSVAQAMLGQMFLYGYDAKTKKDLNYWDKYPLVIPFDILEDGWLGLNLHYLDLKYRMVLFDKLLQFADNKSLDTIQRLRLSYSFLKNFSKFPEVQPCIHRYLADCVKTKISRIQPVDWEIAAFIPIERFQKKSKEFVWAESRKKMKKRKLGF